MAKMRVLVVPWRQSEIDGWTSRIIDVISEQIIQEEPREKIKSSRPFYEAVIDPLVARPAKAGGMPGGRVGEFIERAQRGDRLYRYHTFDDTDALKQLSNDEDVYVLGHGSLTDTRLMPFATMVETDDLILKAEQVAFRLEKMGLRESHTWKGKLKIYACYSALSGLAQEIKNHFYERGFACSVYGYQLAIAQPQPDGPNKGSKVLPPLRDGSSFQYVTAKFVRKEMPGKPANAPSRR